MKILVWVFSHALQQEAYICVYLHRFRIFSQSMLTEGWVVCMSHWFLITHFTSRLQPSRMTPEICEDISSTLVAVYSNMLTVDQSSSLRGQKWSHWWSAMWADCHSLLNEHQMETVFSVMNPSGTVDIDLFPLDQYTYTVASNTCCFIQQRHCPSGMSDSYNTVSVPPESSWCASVILAREEALRICVPLVCMLEYKQCI